MRSAKEKPSSSPAEAVEPETVDQAGKPWEEGETRPFWLGLKATATGPRKVQVQVVAGYVTLDLRDPDQNRKRVLLTEDMLASLKNNADLNIRPAAAVDQDPRGKILAKRRIQPVQKRSAETVGEQAKPPQVEIDAVKTNEGDSATSTEGKE